MVAAFAAQNLEEVLFLPAWMAREGASADPPSTAALGLATGVLTLACLFVVMLSLVAGPARILARWALMLVAGMLVANAVTHVVLSVLTRSLMPGAVSGLILQAPAAGWVLSVLIRDGWTQGRHAVLAVLAGLALSLAVIWASLLAARPVLG